MRGVWLTGCGLALLGAVYGWQRPFWQLPGVEYASFETPPDAQEKTEFAFTRLMFPPGENDGYSSTGRFGISSRSAGFEDSLISGTMVTKDPPDHRKLRNLVNLAFTRR